MTDRLTLEELARLQSMWDSNALERWNHETAISLGCIARPVLPALLSMARRLLEVEGAMKFMYTMNNEDIVTIAKRLGWKGLTP